MLQKLFPDLFQIGVDSINYGVINASLNKNGVLLTGYYLHTFLHELYKAKGFDVDKMDEKISVKQIENHKIFVFEK